MVGKRLNRVAWQVLGLTGLGLGLSACEGAEVSAGDEGDLINLGRCYSADCQQTAQSLAGSEQAGDACEEATVTLDEAVEFESAGAGLTLRVLRPAPDGSFWALAEGTRAALAGEPPQMDEPPHVLVHYSHEGELLGSSELDAGFEFTLGVDTEGNAAVANYDVFAPSADSPLIERLSLVRFDPNLERLDSRLSFRGIGSSLLATDPTGALMLAGDATGNQARGVLTRLTQDGPSWIQTKVPTSGQGVAAGVCGLVVDAAGVSAVLSQRSGRWNGGPDVATFGLALFDADGAPLWDLALPTPYVGGYATALGQLPSGDFVVAGLVEPNSLMLRRVTREGQLGWAFKAGGHEPGGVVDAETGRTFAMGIGQLIAIDADGQRCQQLLLPKEGGEQAILGGELLVQGNDVYITTEDRVRHYQLPDE